MQYETENGKVIQAVKLQQGSLWKVEFKPGGALPKSLSGSYTSEKLANTDIEKYLVQRKAALEDKEKKKNSKGDK